MRYSSYDTVNFEVGDLVVTGGYDSKIVEVVTFVGVEGVMLLSIGGVIGSLERYLKFRTLLNYWPEIIHKRDEEEFKAFLVGMSTKRKG